MSVCSSFEVGILDPDKWGEVTIPTNGGDCGTVRVRSRNTQLHITQVACLDSCTECDARHAGVYHDCANKGDPVIIAYADSSTADIETIPGPNEALPCGAKVWVLCGLVRCAVFVECVCS